MEKWRAVFDGCFVALDISDSVSHLILLESIASKGLQFGLDQRSFDSTCTADFVELTRFTAGRILFLYGEPSSPAVRGEWLRVRAGALETR